MPAPAAADAAFQQWACHVLALSMGLSDSDIKEGTLPYLLSMDEGELVMTLQNFLGDDTEARALIADFANRRFGRTPTKAVAAPSAQPALAPSAHREYKYTAPVAGLSYASASQIVVPPPAPEPAPTNDDQPAECSESVTASPDAKPESNRARKKRLARERAAGNKLTLDDYERLEREGKLATARAECGCHATHHDLLTNCLTCGRIVCVVEGQGPCYTCGALVVSADQQLASAGAPSDALLAAQANRDRLLDYDATSAQRTKVIDVKADHVDFEGAGKLWLSQVERAHAERRRAVQVESLSTRHHRTLDIDLDRGEVLESADPGTDVTLRGFGDVLEEEIDGAMPTVSSWLAVELQPRRQTQDADAVDDRGDGDGTGAFFHPDLAVRPVYVDTAALAAEAEGVADRVKGGKGKARKNRGANAAVTVEKNVATVPGANPVPASGGRSSGRKRASRATPAAGAGQATNEDDPGCG
ncbi:hypothetical protein AMAG_10211 [Allomyces macrogynus ATCC 38327]|uniref:TRIP4/RQT4 C2HC5-type zinc finger domain-containing protein n=1 Tax=Allomyces macrogynus (strain ATCC 38327) TaxID=578462 RepID=A0A0L0SQR1_ALLM3|nr:hypothetical protein AMAG_10211 [Allomyces macrogynus ATCC 38327]|eukprot:KNE64878.1 hypothetical protein AMAG_10211 [Allomyces macrogynus ATCC 38327]